MLWDVPGVFQGCSGVFRGVPGVFRECSGVFRGCSRMFRGVPGVFRVLQTPINSATQPGISLNRATNPSQSTDPQATNPAQPRSSQPTTCHRALTVQNRATG